MNSSLPGNTSKKTDQKPKFLICKFVYLVEWEETPVSIFSNGVDSMLSSSALLI
jgi:hypothetical protein